MHLSHHSVIFGAGRVGRTVATKLSMAGAQVVVVDRSERALAKLPPQFTGLRVLGNAADLQTLREAGLERAQRVFATTEDDNLNLMIAQAAQVLFKIPWVRARVADPSREELYARFGVTIVNPTALAAEALLREVGTGARG